MRHARDPSSLWWLSGLLLVALACSHDSPRDNPMDPTLTPPVELQVSLDDTAGTAALTWTRYEGEQPFAQYLVQRKVKGMELWGTLDSLTSLTQVAYLDTALVPDTAYEYRVAVVNASGHVARSNRETAPAYTVGAVQLLEAKSDPEAGAIRLRWSRYRDPGFAAYEVVRRQVGTDRDTVLFISHSGMDTAFADNTALHEVPYAYRVQVTAAGQELPSGLVNAHLSLPGVTITRARFSSTTASCSLAWTPYRGPRFARYQIVRRQEGIEPKIVEKIASGSATTFADTGLHGNTQYSYQVTVLTVAGREIASDTHSGSFHELADTWSLDVAADGFVRLYAEQDGRITALVTDRTSIRLLFLDTDGQVQGEQVLVKVLVPQIQPRSVSTTVREDGARVLSLSARHAMMEGGDWVSLWQITPEGRAVLWTERIPADELGLVPDISDMTTSVRLVSHDGLVSFDNVMVWQDGDRVIEQGFDDVPDTWRLHRGVGVVDARVVDGQLQHPKSYAGSESSVRLDRPVLQQIRLEVDLAMRQGTGGVRIQYSGGTTNEKLALRLRVASELDYGRISLGRPDIWLQRRFPVLGDYPYRLGLEIADGGVSVSVEHPAFWYSFQNERVTWAGVVAVGDALGVMAGADPRSVLADGDEPSPTPWASPVAEMRTWSEEGGRYPRLGLCSVELNQVHYFWARLDVGTGALLWPLEQFAETLGAGMGQGAGELLAPLSFDVGPDGRFYVLDAGNDRIQVFDRDGGYLTQWGHAGGAPGEFEFGTGTSADSFAGSLCVDDDGYIYVADVFNQRIQVFSPD